VYRNIAQNFGSKVPDPTGRQVRGRDVELQEPTSPVDIVAKAPRFSSTLRQCPYTIVLARSVYPKCKRK
jgi:hypothetical protein